MSGARSWALSADLNMLRRTVADAGHLPVELYDACSSALRRLDVRCRNGECPLADQDALIADYRDGLRAAALDVLAADAVAQQVAQSRAAINGNDALIGARDAALAVFGHAAALSEGWLSDALPADAALATDLAAEPQERAVAAFRLSGRVLRILREVRKGFALGTCAISGSVAYLQALEWLANTRNTQQLLLAIYRYLGL